MSQTCKRRRGSFNASQLNFKICKNSSSSAAAGDAAAAGASHLSLTDLPTELGIVIVNHMTVEAGPHTAFPFQRNSNRSSVVVFFLAARVSVMMGYPGGVLEPLQLPNLTPLHLHGPLS
jgi:hypothetical protein